MNELIGFPEGLPPYHNVFPGHVNLELIQQLEYITIPKAEEESHQTKSIDIFTLFNLEPETKLCN